MWSLDAYSLETPFSGKQEERFWAHLGFSTLKLMNSGEEKPTLCPYFLTELQNMSISWVLELFNIELKMVTVRLFSLC